MAERPTATYLKNYARGLLMGGSDVIPGVSGGTMALILGIYERLILSISAAFSLVLAAVRLDRQAMREHSREVDWSLVIPLGLGIVSAIAIAASVILGLIERFPHHTQALFFGLVAASIAVPWLRMSERGLREAVVAIVCMIIAFLLVGLPQAVASDPNLLRVFASAAVAICAMILPGVSGAFLLKAMGLYEVTLAALRALDVVYVAVFIGGAAIGLGLFAKLLSWLLDRHHDLTMAALIGLMAGALRSLWPYLSAEGDLLAPGPGDPVFSVILLGIIGFLLVAALIFYAQRGSRPHPVDQRETISGAEMESEVDSARRR